MNYKLGVIALVALQAYSACAGRLCVCARNLSPVCGSDGVTYSNECKLDCEKYSTKSDLTKTSDGPCSDSYYPAECICPMDYNPVCGNDGVTYSNLCALRCKLSTNPRIETAHQGRCGTKMPCTCTDDLNEVCGTDGKTYANSCLLNCATANDNTLGIKHAGKCETDNEDNDQAKPPSCTCVRDYKPVCGSDGTTYANDCLLNCATANDNTLSVKHAGKCDSIVVVDSGDLPTPPACTCGKNVKPVCGSDGKTYPNDCLLNCATANDNTLSIKHAGKCETVKMVDNLPIPPACVCGRNVKPVCGSDGKTYANACLLNCATANDNTLSIKHAGKCETVKVANLPTPPPCTCTEELNEVCGTNGKTYGNSCLLNCATANDHTLGISHAGKCGHVNIVNNTPTGCTCTRDLEPVCGSDGVTYNNMCLLECAGQSVAKHGEC